MTVLSLVPKATAADEVQESVIALLENALSEARAGNVCSIVIIATHPNGEWSDWQSATDQMPEVVGRLEMAKQKRISRAIMHED